MGTIFGGEGLRTPGASPALAANFPLAVGTGSEILGVKGKCGVANLATLGIIDKSGFFFIEFRQGTKPPTLS
jgi:hypothetical protein